MSIYRPIHNSNYDRNDMKQVLSKNHLSSEVDATQGYLQRQCSTFRPFDPFQQTKSQTDDNFNDYLESTLPRSSRLNTQKLATNEMNNPKRSFQDACPSVPCVPPIATKTLPRYNTNSRTVDSPRPRILPESTESTLKNRDPSVSNEDIEFGLHYPQQMTKFNPVGTLDKYTSEETDNIQTLRQLEAEISALKSSLQSYDTWPNRKIYEQTQFYESLPSTKSLDGVRGQVFAIYKTFRESGLYRLATIMDSNTNSFKRFLWVVLILACMIVFAYHIHDRVQLLRRSATKTVLHTTTRSSQIFPAVTICNINRFRLTKVKEMEEKTSFNPRNFYCPPGNSRCQNEMKPLRHLKESLIAGCVWDGKPCAASNFTEAYVNDRWCYTIHPQQPVVLWPGSSGSLSLLVNVEQYEYTPDIRTAVGVRLYIHSPSYRPYGEPINIGVGSHAAVAINSGCQQQTTGKERENIATDDPCTKEHASNTCSLTSGWLFRCIKSDYATFFKTSLSYSAMSSYAAESRVRSLTRLNQLKETYKQALDTYHRLDHSVYNFDLQTLRNLSRYFAEDSASISDLLKNATLYRKQTNQSLDRIVQSFLTLNRTFWTYLPTFQHSSHLYFINVYNNIDRDIKDIIRYIEDGNPVKMILDKLKILLVNSKTSHFGAAIAGVKSFNQNIVMGYGQKYEEFRKAQRQYQTLISLLLNSTNRLNGLLHPYFAKLSDLYYSNQPNRDGDMDILKRKLMHFLKSTKEIGSVFRLVANIQTLYGAHRDEIFKFMETLKQAGESLFKVRLALLEKVKNLWNTLPDMKLATNKLSKIFAAVGDDYQKGLHNKSELWTYLNSMDTFTHSQLIKRSLEKLHEDNFHMTSTIVSLEESIRSIASRLSVLPTYPGNSSLIVRNLEHVNAINSFIEGVSNHSGLLNSLENELEDFKKSLKIDHKFYLNNFLRCDVFFKDFTHTTVGKHLVYGIIDFACDLGGCMALYLGISILTVIQFCDVFLRTALQGKTTQSN